MQDEEQKDELTDVVEILQTEKPTLPNPKQQVLTSDGTVVQLADPLQKTKVVQ
jgi:hypothetical protein